MEALSPASIISIVLNLLFENLYHWKEFDFLN